MYMKSCKSPLDRHASHKPHILFTPICTCMLGCFAPVEIRGFSTYQRLAQPAFQGRAVGEAASTEGSATTPKSRTLPPEILKSYRNPTEILLSEISFRHVGAKFNFAGVEHFKVWAQTSREVDVR